MLQFYEIFLFSLHAVILTFILERMKPMTIAITCNYYRRKMLPNFDIIFGFFEIFLFVLPNR